MKLSTQAILAYSHAFEALSSGRYENFRLWSCRVNGEESLEIIALHQQDEKTIVAQPLFVAITEGMVITDEDGQRQGGGGGGGPDRESVSTDFAANKDVTSPHPGG